VTVRDAAVRREIEDVHERPFHELGGCRFSVVNPENVQERLIGHRVSLCTSIDYSKAFGWYLPTVYVHHEVV